MKDFGYFSSIKKKKERMYQMPLNGIFKLVKMVNFHSNGEYVFCHNKNKLVHMPLVKTRFSQVQ